VPSPDCPFNAVPPTTFLAANVGSNRCHIYRAKFRRNAPAAASDRGKKMIGKTRTQKVLVKKKPRRFTPGLFATFMVASDQKR
jgi:hypothetical protein